MSFKKRSLILLFFDQAFYAKQAKLESKDSEYILKHYLHIGWKRGLNPTSSFRTSRYLNALPELRTTDTNPFFHYLFEVVGEPSLSSAFDGLSLRDIETLRAGFDEEWYLNNYPDVETLGVDPLIDYMTSGWRASKNPSGQFSTSAYLDRYADVENSGMNPFRHWVFHGRAEGRSGAYEMPPPSAHSVGRAECRSPNDPHLNVRYRLLSVAYHRP